MKNLKFLLLLFFPGFVGILSMLPVMASLPALQGENMPAPLWLLLTASVGNAAFGLVAGYLYWKHGLECAIAAHMVAHLTMIIGAALV